MVEEITLSGSAISGVEPGLLRAAGVAAHQLPTKVRLGAILTPPPEDVPQLAAFFAPERMTTTPPPSTNYRAVAAASLSRMYLNDRYGCCVISGKMHSLGVWSANDLGAEHTVLATDNEVEQQYRAICGPGDRGCQISRVLTHMRQNGLRAGNALYRIDGFVAVNNQDKLQTQVAQVLFGSNTVGIQLPEAWTSSSVWDITSTEKLGGHDVSVVDYAEQGVYVSSWGRVYRMTWDAWLSRDYVQEYYAILAPLWYGNDQLSPLGIDVKALKAALAALGEGHLPDLPPSPSPGPGPGPGPEPAPLPPPAALFSLSFAQETRAGARVQFISPVLIPPGLYDVVPAAAAVAVGGTVDD